MRIKTAKSSCVTQPISVSFKPGVREMLVRLIAVRKLAGLHGTKPRSVVGIVDEAIKSMAALRASNRKVNYIPVPANGCRRFSIRVRPATYRIAQKGAAKDDVRITDYIRTAVALYLQKHEREIAAYRVLR